MKCATAILVMSAAILRLDAQEAEQKPHPDTVFRLALREIEQDFVAGMRKLAAKASTVRIYRIGALKADLDPFTDSDGETMFRDQEGAYPVLKAGDPITNKEVILSWAETILPKESHPFAVCAPSPGFAVRFLDSDGATVYSTTICLRCQSAAMIYPMYSSRIGFDLKAMKRLLTAAGFSAADLKAEPQR